MNVEQICCITDYFYNLSYTVKSVYNDYPWDPKIVVAVDRWLLFRGHLCNKISKWDLNLMDFIDRWSLFGDGR